MGPTVIGHACILRVVQIRPRQAQYIIDHLSTRSDRNVENVAGRYMGLEVDEDGMENAVLVVGLVEKRVFAGATFGCPFFEDTLLVDPVFGAESLPVCGASFEARSASRSSSVLERRWTCSCKMATDWMSHWTKKGHSLISILSELDCHNFARHGARG